MRSKKILLKKAAQQVSYSKPAASASAYFFEKRELVPFDLGLRALPIKRRSAAADDLDFCSTFGQAKVDKEKNEMWLVINGLHRLSLAAQQCEGETSRQYHTTHCDCCGYRG
ncbi:hypothetical protein LL912_12930 [Niabella sp. CC-SYL272]|uniref:hypothetical protein n=1 Tax=Niabella agricola TaxID=2891571 RepID=UPI001F439466|nr:hypothetical protein [Niabella agricola]MCF3109677.1 hypothetical protein [Niabella agricola]